MLISTYLVNHVLAVAMVAGLWMMAYVAFKLAHALLDMFFFACGFLLLTLLNVNYQKAKQNPLGFLWFLCRRFGSGLYDAVSDLRPVKVTHGNWVWIPLFRLRRKEI